MPVDRDRAQVYAAESAAFEGTDMERVIGQPRVAEAIDRVVRDPWWPGGAVTVRPMRAGARSSATRCSADDGGGVADIGIADEQATVATAAHELAHALAGVGHGHDARFRRAHLDVVQVITNTDRTTARGSLHVEQLHAAYRSAGLAVGERTWGDPPSTGAIAL